MAFNAFKYVDELREAGIPDKQAEAHLRVLSSVIESELATKHDIELLKKDIEAIRADLKRDIKVLEEKMELKIESIVKDIKASQGTQTLQMLGGMAALLAIFRFLPEFLKAAS